MSTPAARAIAISSAISGSTPRIGTNSYCARPSSVPRPVTPMFDAFSANTIARRPRAKLRVVLAQEDRRAGFDVQRDVVLQLDRADAVFPRRDPHRAAAGRRAGIDGGLACAGGVLGAQPACAERLDVEDAFAPHILRRQGEGGRWHERSHAPTGERGAGPEHGAARRRVTRHDPYDGSDGRLEPRAHLRGAAAPLPRAGDADGGPRAAHGRVQSAARDRSWARRRGARWSGRRRHLRRQRHPGRRPAHRAGLRRPPVRLLHGPRRWPRDPARRAGHAIGRPRRHPAERAGAHAVLHPRRRARRARADAARIHHQRGDARARHSDDAEPGGGRDRRNGLPRYAARRRRADARGGEPHPCRHDAVGRGAPGSRGAPGAGGLHAGATLPRARGGARALRRPVRRDPRAAGAA